MHRLKTKRTKKKPAYQCLSSLSGMSQMSIFFPHFIQKAHLVCSRLCGWVFACVYVHRWEWFKSRFGVVVFFWLSFSWFQKSLFMMRAAVWCPWVNHAKPQIFTIHLCVYAAVKSTNTINHTSKSNVKWLLRKKMFVFFLSTKDFKKGKNI